MQEYLMDDEDLQRIASREMLAKQGLTVAAYFAGGVLMIIMSIGSRVGIFGLILSAAALVTGIGALLSKDRDYKKPGLILTAAGILGIVMRYIKILPIQSIAGTFLLIGAVSLFVTGILKGIKFLKNLMSRF